jgi:hypothetical protein
MRRAKISEYARQALVGSAATLAAAMALFALGGALTVLIGATRVQADDDERLRPLAAVDEAWQSECGACHMAYPPGLLPWPAWRDMLAGLDDHFGENAALPPGQLAAISEFLRKNAGDVDQSRLARKLAADAAKAPAPIRISTLPRLLREHDEISRATFAGPEIGSRANCVACHQGAEHGDFSEDDVRIPKRKELK